MLGLPRRSDSLRRTAAAGCGAPQWPIMHEKGTSSLTDPVSTSHGRVKETPLDCKRTLPPAHSCGVSARPRPPRRARQGRTRRRCETCRRRERLFRRVCTSKITVGAGHARRSQSSHPIFLQQIDQKLPQASTSRPHCCRTPGRGRLTRHSCATPANAPQNDPDWCPSASNSHEQVRRPGPGPLVPELAVCGRRPAPRPRDDY